MRRTLGRESFHAGCDHRRGGDNGGPTIIGARRRAEQRAPQSAKSPDIGEIEAVGENPAVIGMLEAALEDPPDPRKIGKQMLVAVHQGAGDAPCHPEREARAAQPGAQRRAAKPWCHHEPGEQGGPGRPGGTGHLRGPVPVFIGADPGTSAKADPDRTDEQDANPDAPTEDLR